jgi:Flp pilus assembly protein TadG
MGKYIDAFVISTRRMLKAFRDNQLGTTSSILAIAAIPMFLGAGAAIDMARVNEASTHFAAALDAAALAAAADTTGKTEAELEVLARAYLDQNYRDSEVKKILTFDLKSYPDRIEVTGTTRVKTTIMGLAQIDYVDLELEAEVIKAGSSIEVSLVLDNTGSMASGTKMASLKAAAKNFVNTVVWTGSTPYYSKVALVPYSMGVNVDTYAAAARGPITAGTSTTPGSTNFTFTNMNGNSRTYAISTCVSERAGTTAYTDDAITSTTRVGRVYLPSSSSCLNSKLLPLTNDKAVLNARIDAMSAVGSTAGHVGVAWGWYTLSPTIGLWSGSSLPAAYGTEKLKKIMILMTDAEYNTNYCNGVRSSTSTSGSGSTDTHINCSAPNGSSWTQAKALCAAMKLKGVEIYTIEFELDTSIAARVDLVQSCATDSAHRFNAANETQLNAAFQAIAMNLLDLRVSK